MTDKGEVQTGMGVPMSQAAAEFLYSTARLDEQGWAWVRHLRDTVTSDGVTLPPDAVEELTDVLDRLAHVAGIGLSL